MADGTVLRLAVCCRINLVRSPMAEAVLLARLGATGEVQVRSAGLEAITGLERPRGVLDVLEAAGYPPPPSAFSRRLDAQLLQWADLVLVMEASQRQTLLRLAPAAAAKVWRLGHWQATEVADPDGLAPQALAATLRTIETCVGSWLPHLQSPLHQSDPIRP